MRWRLWLVTLGLLSLVIAEAAEGGNKAGATKRRKVRRKVLISNKSGAKVEETKEDPDIAAPAQEETDADEEVTDVANDQESRDARGFLDQYYQQFDKRVLPALDKSEAAIVEDEISAPYAPSQSLARQPISYSSNSGGGGGSSGGSSPYLNPVPIPEKPSGPYVLQSYSQEPSSSTVYGTVTEEKLPSGYLDQKRTFTLPSPLGSSDGYVLQDTSTNYIDDSSSGYKTSSSYETKPLASKYFGVATTTSQDIQLGLTFTVPFLSIPLSSITNIFSGDGLGSIGNVFDNFDTTSLVTIAVIALGAIFILPQAIYWLTGVNLSAFNWGRSDDPNYLVNLANTVDRALSEYDINVRDCLTTSMCQQMKTQKNKGKERKNAKEGGQTKEEESTITGMLGYGIIKSAAKSATLRKFMGEARMNEIIGVSESSYSCEEVFSGDVCPWHPNTSKKVIAKLILNSDLDMATLANLAVQGAKAFSS